MQISNRVKIFLLILHIVNISYGQNSFTDNRDGEVYNTMIINGIEWMTDNLRYKSEESYFFLNKSQLQEHGRLYRHAQALTVCPEGWKLPTIKDWENLINYYGGREIAGKFLKKKSDDWYSSEATSEIEPKGFNITPSGIMFFSVRYNHFGERVFYWASDIPEYDKERALGVLFDYRYHGVYAKQGFYRETGTCVRCIKK